MLQRSGRHALRSEGRPALARAGGPACNGERHLQRLIPALMADAGPLIRLSRIGRLGLLRDLFRQDQLTATVLTQLRIVELEPGRPPFAGQEDLAEALEVGWLRPGTCLAGTGPGVIADPRRPHRARRSPPAGSGAHRPGRGGDDGAPARADPRRRPGAPGAARQVLLLQRRNGRHRAEGVERALKAKRATGAPSVTRRERNCDVIPIPSHGTKSQSGAPAGGPVRRDHVGGRRRSAPGRLVLGSSGTDHRAQQRHHGGTRRPPRRLPKLKPSP